MIKMGSFRSYVGLDEYDNMRVPQPSNGILIQPKLLNGELVIAEAKNVLKTSLTKTKGISGSLFVTNARLVFVSSGGICCEDSIPLLSINTLVQYEDYKGPIKSEKKKRIKMTLNNEPINPSMYYSVSTKILEIIVITSNFRSLRISFKCSDIDQGARICNALIHHSFPENIERLFYFDYCKQKKSENLRTINSVGNETPVFYDVPGDWLREMKRTRISGYRVTKANEGFEFCQSIPESFLVPDSFSDVRLKSLGEKLKGNRPPFWVWGDYRGAAIIRIAKLNNEEDSLAENAFFELLRKTQKNQRKPCFYDLDAHFPVKDLKHSFNKLIELTCPETIQQYLDFDSRFLSLLDQTKWLSWISKILCICGKIADCISKTSDIIILQEYESRDTSCLISSVSQIIVDARFRTVLGFFTLIQKDWIAFGHPFRSGYMQASPIFLMFLDSVHQLILQNQLEFEFNEQLLIEVWDSVFDSTVGSFLFNTAGQRKRIDSFKEYTFWNKILTKEEDHLNSTDTDPIEALPIKSLSSILSSPPRRLLNPLFKLKPLLYPPNSADEFIHTLTLSVSSFMSDLQFWNNLYLSRNQIDKPRMIDPNIKNACTPGFPLTPSTKGSNESQSPINQTTSFIFQNVNDQISKFQGIDNFTWNGGRDPLIESQFVDLLLAALSSSTKYQRNSVGSAGSNKGNYHQQQHQSSSQSRNVSSAVTSRNIRRNPFH